eukprot:CAMPEP_0185599450 /NCGR_PEP_ID=MMETSP0434-20130131/82718_1 /TAXON_ID=626734 ORGANISM="Favella taraikaensis, Strain Fe Narragansett Bay" /NCGR_SAMPLE_ID=MMETSP0434 /ASSEMBLY_ACC=CAM_ASM_000379 /LENGTH=316 /DNA_ID=CAMNT_0028228859 /DNA_START=377 /DNA_END=1327 /DNA_ORIENTATION=-
MRTCGDDVCEFRFEENNLGNIFNEVKRDPEMAMFLVGTAFSAFISSRAPDLTEPFPSFLLSRREMRPKEGNLAYVQEAQKAGQDVKMAKKIEKSNKQTDLGAEYLKVIYSVLQDIDTIKTEQDFKREIDERALFYFTSDEERLAQRAAPPLLQASLVHFDDSKARARQLERQHYVGAGCLARRLSPQDFDNLSIIAELQNNRHAANLEQVIVVSDHTLEVEQEFARRRQQTNSIFAYHGTGFDCLYSLTRNGLRNLSNTQFMTTGAVHGAGIYIGPNYATAAAYAKTASISYKGYRPGHPAGQNPNLAQDQNESAA